MIPFGVIGTSNISHRFIEAAHLSAYYQLRAVFSRKIKTALTFSSHYENVAVFTDLEVFLSSPIKVVYIASPNALHFKQAKAVLKAGKHAIIEKPMVSTPQELAELRNIAKEKGVFLFEAARNYQEKAFAIIRDFLADKTILGAYFSYAKYSSKMPELLAGKTPNIFSTEFSGGALMALGVYTLYAAIGLFGSPIAARYTAQQLPSSIDLNGIGQLFYNDFHVTIHAGKNVTSNLPSEIHTSEGTLTLNACQYIHSAIFTKYDGTQLVLPIQQANHSMLEEAKHIGQVIQENNQQLAENWLDSAQIVHQTLYTMRKDAGITFKVDTYEN